MNYQEKYLKYKEKYLNLKKQIGGDDNIMSYINITPPKDFKLTGILTKNHLGDGNLVTTTFGNEFTYLKELIPDWGEKLHADGNSMSFEDLRDITMDGLVFWYCKFIIGIWKEKRNGSLVITNYATDIRDDDEALDTLFKLIRPVDYLQKYAVAFSRLKVILEKAREHPQNNRLGKLCDKIQYLIVMSLFRMIGADLNYKVVSEDHRNYDMQRGTLITQQQIDFLQSPVSDVEIASLHVESEVRDGKYIFSNIYLE